MITFWDLPGPAKLLTTIETELRAVPAVAVMLPRTTGITTFRTAVERRVRACELWSWRPLDLVDLPRAATEPLQHLCDRLRPFDAVIAPSVDALAGFDAGVGSVFFVHGFTTDAWRRWAAFLKDYLQFVRNSAARDAPRFCLSLSGLFNPGELAPDAGLSVLAFDRYVDEYDAGMLARSHYAGRLSPMQARIATAVSVEIAGPDEGIVQALGAASFEEVMSPTAALERVAHQREWCRGARPEDWASGRLEVWRGRLRRNSASLAAEGDHHEIARRVWKGQIQVLFPALEEIRAQLIAEVLPYCELPFVSKFGTLSSVEDLELSHLHYFARMNGAPRRVVQLLGMLCGIRHALAHLEPVAADYLAHEVFLDAAGVYC